MPLYSKSVDVIDAAADTTTWVMLAGSQTGVQKALSDAGLTYDANSNLLGASITGNAATLTNFYALVAARVSLRI